jgi:sigma-B regulation protein RsbQ
MTALPSSADHATVPFMTSTERNNVKVIGRGEQPMIFAHGYGCDQNMWRFITPAFEDDYRVVTFDHVGSGQSDLRAYSRSKYASLQGYADDVLEICASLALERVVFVGHSVSAMIGMLASIAEPERFDAQIMIGPSPCYINDGDYVGGFTRKDILELLDTLENNYLGWASNMAPAIMGAPEQPHLAVELTNSFCRTDPEIAKQFARVTFLSDLRQQLPSLRVPTLIVQCNDDLIAPVCVGEYMHRVLPKSTLAIIDNVGHCPHLSNPSASSAAMDDFLARCEI